MLGYISNLYPEQRFQGTHLEFKIKCQPFHIYTVEYYSAIKRNKIELLVVRWMDLGSLSYRVKSEREKQIPYVNTYIWNLKKKNGS